MNTQKRIEIQILTKRNKLHSLMVPAIMEVCPNCEGTSGGSFLPESCVTCNGLNVIQLANYDLIAKYPRILAAWNRFDADVQADAWERYGERLCGC